MPAQPVIEPQFQDLSGRFMKAVESLDKETQAAVHRLGSKWVQSASAEAPRSQKFGGGTFASGMTYQPFAGEGEYGFYGLSPQPLGQYIKLGTKPHPIRARNAGALRFIWTKRGLLTIVPKRGGFRTNRVGNTLYIGKGRVDHPGTKPNPYHLRAFEKFWPQVEEEVKALSQRFVVRLAGPTQ